MIFLGVRGNLQDLSAQGGLIFFTVSPFCLEPAILPWIRIRRQGSGAASVNSGPYDYYAWSRDDAPRGFGVAQFSMRLLGQHETFLRRAAIPTPPSSKMPPMIRFLRESGKKVTWPKRLG